MHEALETQTTKKNIPRFIFNQYMQCIYNYYCLWREVYLLCKYIYHLHIVLILLLNDVLCYYGERICVLV